MTELTYAALRQIMYQPSAVWLATEYSGDRWLHDQWVMLNVTGHPALVRDVALEDHASEGCTVELDDGAYKLMADSDKGLQPRDSIPPADIEAYFEGLKGDWHRVRPTQWSVAEHPGKAMLWHYGNLACLLGESTWTAIKRHYPECAVYYLPDRNIFQFCEYPKSPFCFAAGIRIPDGEEYAAYTIAVHAQRALTQPATTSNLEGESTSNEE